MCGIAGFLGNFDHSEATLLRMTQAIAHRGPDADGVFHEGLIHLGHRRLAVIDLETGRQPLFNEDGSIALVFNGEIYNFAQLRAELIQAGHQFSTHTDSEVLIHGYEAWGTQLLQRIQGMFAFAIWDSQQQSLFLARDHLGVKPLHYVWLPESGSLIFASEVKALLEHPAVHRTLDTEALGLFLECQYIPTPRSIYASIKKLPPGHSLTVQHQKISLERYWHLSYPQPRVQDETEAIASTELALRRSVKSMLVADVPLGVFLSGGVDSSLIAALVSQERSQPVDTFTLGFSGQVQGSEHLVAEVVANHIGSRHHVLMLEADDVLHALSSSLNIFDEPFADPATLPTLLLSEFAKKHVTVVLTGEGADEIFAGYGNYSRRMEAERWVRWLGHPYSPLPLCLRWLPGRLRKDRWISAILAPTARRYATIPSVFDAHLRTELYTPAFLAQHHESIFDYAEQLYLDCDAPDYLNHLLHIDRGLWLPDDLLTKVDRATMAHALEARVPYLDHHFVEFCAGLDPRLKCRGRTGKYLLKKIASRHLPETIVYRNRQGFMLPLREWLAGPLRQPVNQALTNLAERGLFQRSALARLKDEHYSDRRHHAGRLWTLLVLEHWFQRHSPEFSL